MLSGYIEKPSGITEDQELAIRALQEEAGKLRAAKTCGPQVGPCQHPSVGRSGPRRMGARAFCSPSSGLLLSVRKRQDSSPQHTQNNYHLLHCFTTIIRRRPPEDKNDLTETDLELSNLEEFQLWTRSFPGMSSVSEDHRAEICNGLIQTFNAKRPGEDTRSSQVTCREDGTNQGAKFSPPAAAHGDPRKFPQDLESPGGASGDSPSTSSTGPSPYADTVSTLFASIRRILSADPSNSAEDIISAIQKRSYAINLGLSGPHFEHAITDALTSEATAGQESTSQGTKETPIGTSGRSRLPEKKRQKTCTPSDAEGDDEDGSEDGEGDSDGGGGGGRAGPPPSRTPEKPSERWMCPYCLHYVEITRFKGFESCGRPGFLSRDQLR